ncbi:MAG: hypothetical protein HYZ20_02220 [Burkholderiales bacterium]|nr:hypothetical protein [Burkholderiales bacterium]
MQAIRETHDVSDGSVTIRLPQGFSARRVEVIVLPADEDRTAGRVRERRPAPELAGTVIRDDLIQPAVAPEEWDALR